MEVAPHLVKIAENIHQQHEARQPFTPLPEQLRPTDLTEAYAVQDALHDIRAAAGHGPIVGYKIALTSHAMQQMVGLASPCAGAIFETRVHESPARLSAGDFMRIGIECEIATHLAKPLPPTGVPYSADSVREAVDAIRPAFEIVEDRNADYATLDAASLIADNCWNGGVVLGPPVDDWRSLDLAKAEARLFVNDALVGEGRTGDAMGHPFEALAWLANLMNERGRAIDAGMFVMTGSVVVTKFPKVGEVLRFEVDGLGAVEAAVED